MNSDYLHVSLNEAYSVVNVIVPLTAPVSIPITHPVE